MEKIRCINCCGGCGSIYGSNCDDGILGCGVHVCGIYGLNCGGLLELDVADAGVTDVRQAFLLYYGVGSAGFQESLLACRSIIRIDDADEL